MLRQSSLRRSTLSKFDNGRRLIPNGIFRSKRDNRTYIGDQLDGCDDFGGLLYRLPFEKVSSDLLLLIADSCTRAY
jgi:hypothetical protein